MKIAIISDTHDNLATLKKAITWLDKEKFKLVIHCGDIFKPEVIKEIQKVIKAKIYIIFSPVDASFSEIPENSFDNLPGIKIFKKFGEIEIDTKKIAFCHFPEIAEELAKKQKYDFIFYGHTHKPWLKTLRRGSEQETKLVNPGNLANLFYKATFAIYDTKTDKLELKILEKL